VREDLHRLQTRHHALNRLFHLSCSLHIHMEV
jgi:hypothetical protein